MTTTLVAPHEARPKNALTHTPTHALSHATIRPEAESSIRPEAESSVEERVTKGQPPVLEYVFEVEGMGRGERWGVEKQMLLLPEGEPGEVWFTRWRRAPDGTYSCRERIVGTAEEIEAFAAGVEALAERGNFVARVTQRTYAWAYV
ncbi:hypothetical protein QP446_10705 [Corynebacterium riegelii]|uniref:hypothetical protein n=1 Tax=Corynebacterium riegelii TaxID=156976 RepID=UPI00254C522D|nr:hypothetical protein [Corynebacterium riegelii]MDK7181221.1 hypothetical protein [Corynebacterium riegelii]